MTDSYKAVENEFNAYITLAEQQDNEQMKSYLGYYKWLKSEMKEVELTSIFDLFSPEQIEDMKDVVQPKVREAYRVVNMLTQIFPNITYVEGKKVFNGLTIWHAVNKIVFPNGDIKYFDLNTELAPVKDTDREKTFIAIREFSKDEIEEIERKTELCGEYLPVWYQDNVHQVTV